MIMQHVVKYTETSEDAYIGIRKFNLDTMCELPKDVTREPMPHNPFLLAMVQNEDQVDYWVLDPKDRVSATQTLTQYYEDQEPWVVKNPRGFNIRVFSLSPENPHLT